MQDHLGNMHLGNTGASAEYVGTTGSQYKGSSEAEYVGTTETEYIVTTGAEHTYVDNVGSGQGEPSRVRPLARAGEGR